MRWVIVGLVGAASAGLMAVSVAMNFAFGSSFGKTGFESYAYGAAFALADILKAAAPIVAARSFTNRNWGAALLGMFLWGTFTVCSAVSAIGFASANRTFTLDTRRFKQPSIKTGPITEGVKYLERNHPPRGRAPSAAGCCKGWLLVVAQQGLGSEGSGHDPIS